MLEIFMLLGGFITGWVAKNIHFDENRADRFFYSLMWLDYCKKNNLCARTGKIK